MKKIVKYGAIVLAAILLVVLLSVWWNSPQYHQDWIIGKTKEQVVARFGDFLGYFTRTDVQDGSFLYYEGTYQITPDRVDYLGTWKGKLFCIIFDENGVAFKCYETREGYLS